MAKLVLEGTTDEPGSAREQHLHRRRVYLGALAVLAALGLAGCDHGKRRAEPKPPPAPQLSFVALDRQHQRLVRDYEPVSAAMTAYEQAYRDWRLGRLSRAQLRAQASRYQAVVANALSRVPHDPATGASSRARALLVRALSARSRALREPPGTRAYRRWWNRSLVAARAGLTALQDIRDRARLIPLPEDAVS